MRVVLISTALVLVIGGAGFAVFGFGQMGSEDDSRAAKAPTIQNVDPSELPDPSIEGDGIDPPPEQISIAVASTPQGADVFRASDGLRVGKTPYRYSLDPVQGELVYIVKMDGYEPEKVTFQANKSGEQALDLKRLGGSRAGRKETATSAPDPFESIESNDPAAKEAEALLKNIRESSKKDRQAAAKGKTHKKPKAHAPPRRIHPKPKPKPKTGHDKPKSGDDAVFDPFK